MAIVIYSFSGLYILHTKRIQCKWKKTQNWLNCHYKFILTKNIIITFVSSDDLHV